MPSVWANNNNNRGPPLVLCPWECILLALCHSHLWLRHSACFQLEAWDGAAVTVSPASSRNLDSPRIRLASGIPAILASQAVVSPVLPAAASLALLVQVVFLVDSLALLAAGSLVLPAEAFLVLLAAASLVLPVAVSPVLLAAASPALPAAVSLVLPVADSPADLLLKVPHHHLTTVTVSALLVIMAAVVVFHAQIFRPSSPRRRKWVLLSLWKLLQLKLITEFVERVNISPSDMLPMEVLLRKLKESTAMVIVPGL